MSKKIPGFTMMELLVVVVVVGILSTISASSFKSYLKSGRDSHREVGVENISKVIKLDRASKGKNNYDLLKTQIIGIAANHSTKLPTVQSEKHYFYGYSAKKEDFFIIVCGENNQFFVKGTTNGVLAAESVESKDVCDGSAVPIKERLVPLNENEATTNLDAYIIYELN